MKQVIVKSVIKPGVCSNKGCKNIPKGNSVLCPTCTSRKSRLSDLVRYSYNNKKHRADERGIFWDLTLEEFREFCHETDYISKTGKVTGSYDVDRIIEGKTPGYTKGNIQILDKIANIKKYKRYSDETKKAEIVIETIVPPENLPF